jgi:CelD/BcsL family acetyltransferase involved in cellulose biosynthesis
MGEVVFATPDKDAEIVANLDTLFSQKCHALAAMGVDDLFSRPGYQAFFRDVATDPATRDMVHVSHLDVGETLAAANFGLIWRGRYYHILASYDHGPVSRFGPGAAHLHRLMQYAIDRGCNVFDFTIGDERYKREWADTELRLYDHYAAATLRGHGVVAAVFAYRRLKRLIKQTPALWAAYTKMRALAGPLKRRCVDDEDGGEDSAS